MRRRWGTPGFGKLWCVVSLEVSSEDECVQITYRVLIDDSIVLCGE